MLKTHESKYGTCLDKAKDLFIFILSVRWFRVSEMAGSIMTAAHWQIANVTERWLTFALLNKIQEDGTN